MPDDSVVDHADGKVVFGIGERERRPDVAGVPERSRAASAREIVLGKKRHESESVGAFACEHLVVDLGPRRRAERLDSAPSRQRIDASAPQSFE